MDNENSVTKKDEKGCLLTGILLLSIVGALFNAFFNGAWVCVNTPQRMNEMEYWVALVFLVVSLVAIFCVFATFKMRKKGAYGLLSTMVLSAAFLLYDALSKTPASESAKAGAGWMLFMAIGTIICAIILAFHLKKME